MLKTGANVLLVWVRLGSISWMLAVRQLLVTSVLVSIQLAVLDISDLCAVSLVVRAMVIQVHAKLIVFILPVLLILGGPMSSSIEFSSESSRAMIHDHAFPASAQLSNHLTFLPFSSFLVPPDVRTSLYTKFIKCTIVPRRIIVKARSIVIIVIVASIVLIWVVLAVDVLIMMVVSTCLVRDHISTGIMVWIPIAISMRIRVA